jgi:hypothetical protein
MIKRRRPFDNLIPLVIAAMAGMPSVLAQDGGSGDAVTVRKTKEGLHFQLPPDWPVEKRGGVVAPIPIEEYLAKKFSALEARLQAMEQQLGGIDVRLRVLEEEAKKRRETLQSGGSP